jgi:hypothetical protein
MHCTWWNPDKNTAWYRQILKNTRIVDTGKCNKKDIGFLNGLPRVALQKEFDTGKATKAETNELSWKS